MTKAKKDVKKADATPNERVFMHNGIKLDDPDKDMSTEQVRDFYSGMYPELTNASVKGPTVSNGVATFDFKERTGTKG